MADIRARPAPPGRPPAPATVAAGTTRPRRGYLPSRVSLPELVVGGAVLLVAVAGWAALGLANLHAFSLTWVVLVTVVAVAVVAALVALLGGRLRVCLDPLGGLAAVVTGTVAGLFFFPGFSYGATDKDPGAYLAIGSAIARYHSDTWTDTLAAHVSGLVDQTPGARFPAVWADPHGHNLINPQFYHLWPALLAVADRIGGLGAMAQVAPLAGLLAVLTFTLLLRRAVPGRASLPTAVTGGLLLATNMLQVWQDKYPTTEAFTQLCYLGTLLGVVVALRTRWAPAAGLAGLLLGVSWLTRADGLLIALVAVAVGAVLFAVRRFDRRSVWFTVGFAVTLPHVLWQAYVHARAYTYGNGIPHPTVVGAAVLGLAAAGVVGRLTPVGRWLAARAAERNWQVGVGLAVCGVALLLLVLGFERARLFGPVYTVSDGLRLRTLDEVNLRRLSWFVTLPGFALMGLGLAVVALRRWSATLWAVTLPTLVVFPVYAYHARIADRLMWWGRRWVPEVLPGMVILIAVLIGAVVVWRWRRWAVGVLPGLAAAGALFGVYVSQSAPLRGFQEMGGGFAVTAQIAATAGARTGVYLFSDVGCCSTPEYLFGGALWLERGELDGLLPADQASAVALLGRVRAGEPGAPVFVVADGTARPADLPGVAMSPVTHIVAGLSMWTESVTSRPTHPRPPVPVDLTVWRVSGTG